MNSYSGGEGSSFDPNHARVLVVGPMGAGKTALVNSLCHGCDARDGNGGINGASSWRGRKKRPPTPTVGCNVDVKLLAGEHSNRFVEFWDVGGNPDAAPVRKMFFEDSAVAGVLLVYDMSNPRSLRELRVWAGELDSAGISVLADRDTATSTSTSTGNSETPGAIGNGWGRGNSSQITTKARSPEVLDRRSEPLYHKQQTNVGYDYGDDSCEAATPAIVDLEGGGSGGSMATGGGDFRAGEVGGGRRRLEGRVPVVVVGNTKGLRSEEVRSGAGGELLASDLGAAHIIVSANSLDTDSSFNSFFHDVFRHHSGRPPPVEGNYAEAWTFPDDSHAAPAPVVGESRGGREGAKGGGGGRESFVQQQEKNHVTYQHQLGPISAVEAGGHPDGDSDDLAPVGHHHLATSRWNTPPVRNNAAPEEITHRSTGGEEEPTTATATAEAGRVWRRPGNPRGFYNEPGGVDVRGRGGAPRQWWPGEHGGGGGGALSTGSHRSREKQC